MMKRFAAVSIFLLAVAGSALGHKYHTTLTRIDYRPEEKNLEISIRMFVHDVMPMLEKGLKKQVDLERTPGIDAELLRYIGENFVLRTADESDLKLVWVGKEIENDVMYVYVETRCETDPAKLRLKNSLFFDFFAEQSNLVVARFNGKKYDLAFRAGDRLKAFTEAEDGKKTAD